MFARLLGIAAVSAIRPGAAFAGDGDNLRGFIEFGVGVADGEDSWFERGFGKTRFSGEEDAEGVARGLVLWRPQLPWNLNGHLSVQADPDLDPVIDVVEAYVTWRGAPSPGWRFGGRAGAFFPPVSLEHDGPAWTTTNTLTPSAINSWIGEEVKVVGAEANARRRFGDQEFTARVALFGFNDTSGTLLAFRGWALNDVMTGLYSEMPLPSSSYQSVTRPTYGLDGRVGYYAQVEYRPQQNVTLDLLFYDNRGDRVSDSGGQTNWETRFLNAGMRIAFDEDTRLLAQAMSGRTIWGHLTPMGYWVDVDFNSAYVLVARDIDAHRIAARLDYFEIGDRSFIVIDNNDEEGWAATATYQFELTPSLTLAVEGLHVSSDRPSRANQGLDPDQTQSTLQTSLALAF
ncbi:MAG: hypothetical protein ACT4OF_03740 [Caulobacteraceae bacterium]